MANSEIVFKLHFKWWAKPVIIKYLFIQLGLSRNLFTLERDYNEN